MSAKMCVATSLTILFCFVTGDVRAQEEEEAPNFFVESEEDMQDDESPADSWREETPESEEAEEPWEEGALEPEESTEQWREPEPAVDESQQPIIEAETQETQQQPKEAEHAAPSPEPAGEEEEGVQFVGNETYVEAGYKLIAGPLPKVLKAREKPYVVVASIEVPSNRLTTIEPGAVLLFRNFTGLHVQGRLVAEGTKAKPIVFTSEFDTVYNQLSKMQANPFDWDGIYIHDDGIGTMLAYSKVFYSVYGIRSDTKFIRIDPTQFRYNGKSNLTIMGVEYPVTRKPYSYVLSTKDAMVDGVPVNLLRDPAAPRRNFLRYLGLTALISGASVGVYEVLQLRDAQDEYEELSTTSFENLNRHTSDDWEDAQKKRNLDIVYTAASIGAGVLGGVGFVWSFKF